MPVPSTPAADPLPAVLPATAAVAKLGFVAGGERWLVDSGRGAQVIDARVTPVPLTRPWFLGLVRHQQTLLSAVDLGGLCGRAVPSLKPTERLLVLPAPWNTALRVERVHGLVDATALAMATTASPLACAAPQAAHPDIAMPTSVQSSTLSSMPSFDCAIDADGQRWHLLDAAQLCTSAVFLQAGIPISA